jgi:hypothetical protein
MDDSYCFHSCDCFGHFNFFLIARSDGGDWVYAIIMTLIMGEAYLLLPKKWFERFKRKEKNPLMDSKE